MNIIGNEGHGIVVDDHIETKSGKRGTEQVWNKMSRTWNTITLNPRGIGQQYKALRAQLKSAKKESRLQRNPVKQEMIHRGAAKILGLAASHIYAKQPS